MIDRRLSYLDYHSAAAILAPPRRRSRYKVARHTYLERRDDNTIALQFWSTDIVTWKKNGDIRLTTGGWPTCTTRNRINRFAASVWTEQGQWYIDGSPYTRLVPFVNGMILHTDGTVTYPRPLGPDYCPDCGRVGFKSVARHQAAAARAALRRL